VLRKGNLKQKALRYSRYRDHTATQFLDIFTVECVLYIADTALLPNSLGCIIQIIT